MNAKNNSQTAGFRAVLISSRIISNNVIRDLPPCRFGNKASPIHLLLLLLSLTLRPAAEAAADVLQLTKLAPSDSATGDSFGSSVAMDGTRLVVGAPGAGISGAVYVFVRAGGRWQEESKLRPSDAGEVSCFGGSVAISGHTVIVGGSLFLCPLGAAYVFVRSGSTWTQQAKLLGDDSASPVFGSSVGTSGDVVLVGDRNSRASGARAGAVYRFERNGLDWSDPMPIPNPTGISDEAFGEALAFDGNFVIGAHESDERGMSSGSAYINGRKVIPSDITADDNFGQHAAVGGGTALVSTLWAAYAFGLPGGEPARLQHPGRDELTSIAVWDDLAVLGAGAFFASHKVYRFQRTGATWSELPALSSPDSTPVDFGYAVAARDDTIAVGAPHPSAGGPGSVYVFEPDFLEQLRTLVEDLAVAAFKAPGHRAAILSILGDIESDLNSGEEAEAMSKIQSLRSKADGCPSEPDKTDWIVECTAQIRFRQLLNQWVAAQ